MSYDDWGNGGNISDMVGKTFNHVYTRDDNTELVFENATERYVFFHWQDCCESVSIEDITGDVSDLEGLPLLMAEEASGEVPADFDPNNLDSYTWTFYKFATFKGYVDVRWLGTSNGYYSESVSLGHENV